MAKKFTETERKIIDLFNNGKSFVFNGINYTVIKSDKPFPSKGECKTDVYIEAIDSSADTIALKISVKQTNADFLENKISLERAQEIFGTNTSSILASSIELVKCDFEDEYLVCFDKYKKTEAKTIKIGWKFELLNKDGGKRSGKIILTEDQKKDVYAGTNLTKDKRDCIVGGKEIPNSGVANYVLEVDASNPYHCLQTCVDSLVPIDTYIADKELYFACKAINFRVDEMKWDGNRPLSVFVRWEVCDDKLSAYLVFDEPLTHKANEIGNEIKEKLNQLSVSASNFSSLEGVLHEVKYYKKPL